jgi:hypothetical protein
MHGQEVQLVSQKRICPKGTVMLEGAVWFVIMLKEDALTCVVVLADSPDAASSDASP